MTRASESQHWYRPVKDHGAVPVYRVPYADPRKGMRNATLRDARKLRLVPGTSKILEYAPRHQLVQWKIKEGIRTADANPRREGEPLDVYADRILEESGSYAAVSADLGTQIHAAVESHFNDEEYNLKWFDHVSGVVELLDSISPNMAPKWDAEKPCSSWPGYGTKVDLSVPGWWVINIKTHDGKDLDALDVWDSQCMQLAAERRALGPRYTANRCGILYVDRTLDNPKQPVLIEASEAKLKKGLAMFDICHALFQVDTDHNCQTIMEAIR